MFCPNCGQQQASAEMRFCARCGFQLGVVRAVLAADDPAGPAAAPPPDRAQRKKDMTIGAALMFLCAFTVAVITVDMPAAHSGRIVFLLIVWLLLSLAINLRPLWHYFTGRGAAGGTKPEPAQLGGAQAATLPPARAVPAAGLGAQRFDTADVATPPGSVTERTTNLLGDK